MGRYHYVFPRWSNMLLPALCATALLAPLYLVFVVAYAFSPQTTDVGYEPMQPVPYSHRIHAGRLGIDCRYCHNTAEDANKAAIPPTQTCMNCHTKIHKDSPNIQPLVESFSTGMPMQWTRVHDLPDFVYFSHSAHVDRGVSCVSCHGRVDKMEVVYQQETLSMAWCLKCHRDPAGRVRDPRLVTNLGWGQEEGSLLDEKALRAIGEHWIEVNGLSPSQDCSTCHR